MFAGRPAKVVTAACAMVGAVAFVGIFFLTIVGGSEYVEFALALIFYLTFLVGSYWWIVFDPGRL